MKKAIVVGGSNGIGLAIAKKLIDSNRHVIILDVCSPAEKILDGKSYNYIKTDLTSFDNDLFENFSSDEEIDTLFITAGIGRICNFDNLSLTEIEKLFKINSVSAIKILKIFYERIKNTKSFYTGIIGSIAGLVSSPMFSVYSATKASICRFVESVNIELEANGYDNRILNVSPGSIKGTRFNGGENDLTLTDKLSDEIVSRLYKGETLFIPDYDEVYKGVIERYRQNARQFGLDSYEYKQKSGRISDKSPIVIGYLSGTFDLFHIGHLNLIRRAKAECDYLIVGVHPDASHKGKTTIIPFEERMEIVGACKYVDKVVMSFREDSDAWDEHHFNKLFVGSDYKGTERFLRYEEYFKDKNVEIVYFSYTKGISSTQIRETLAKK
ncbi:MAG: SDR family NAD(P)-dependent oxidoreductase [Clostridia bacterium]|nr:SDR family NAD(P)-dependent oxidoreductase [Clostridia bacterium]